MPRAHKEEIRTADELARRVYRLVEAFLDGEEEPEERRLVSALTALDQVKNRFLVENLQELEDELTELLEGDDEAPVDEEDDEEDDAPEEEEDDEADEDEPVR